MVSFDGDPTADAEQYNKLDRSIRDEYESQVSCVQDGLTCLHYYCTCASLFNTRYSIYYNFIWQMYFLLFLAYSCGL